MLEGPWGGGLGESGGSEGGVLGRHGGGGRFIQSGRVVGGMSPRGPWEIVGKHSTQGVLGYTILHRDPRQHTVS